MLVDQYLVYLDNTNLQKSIISVSLINLSWRLLSQY